MDVRHHDDLGRDAPVTVLEGQHDVAVGGAGAAHQRGRPGGAAGRRGHQLPVQPDGDAPGPRVRMDQSGHTDTAQDHSQVRAIRVLRGILQDFYVWIEAAGEYGSGNKVVKTG